MMIFFTYHHFIAFEIFFSEKNIAENDHDLGNQGIFVFFITPNPSDTFKFHKLRFQRAKMIFWASKTFFRSIFKFNFWMVLVFWHREGEIPS